MQRHGEFTPLATSSDRPSSSTQRAIHRTERPSPRSGRSRRRRTPPPSPPHRPRKSASSITNSGVPNSPASAVTGTPATRTSSRPRPEPGCAATPSAPAPACRRRSAAGAALRRGGPPRRGAVRPDGRSHPLRRAHTEDSQAVGDHLTGRLAQCQPGTVQVGRLLVAVRQDPAGVAEAVVVAGKILQIAADPVRFAQGSRGLQDAWNSPRLRISVPSLSWQRCPRCATSASKPSSAALRASAQPGVGVLHVIDRVLVGRRGPQRQVDVDGVSTEERMSAYRAASTPMASTGRRG